MLSESQVAQLNLNIINLPVAIVLSLALGVWACWEKPFRAVRVLVGLGFGLAVAIGNILFAFVGCVIGSNFLRF